MTISSGTNSEKQKDKSCSNPFVPIYHEVNGGTNEEKYNRILQSNGEALPKYIDVELTKLNHLNVDSMKIDEAEKEKIHKLQQQEAIRKVYRPVCNEAFDKLSINWNGDVTLCCSDYDNFMIVGNILDSDLKQIFNSNAAKTYREIIADHRYGRIKCCSECYETVPLTK